MYLMQMSHLFDQTCKRNFGSKLELEDKRYGETVMFQQLSVAQTLASYHIWKGTPPTNVTPTSTKSSGYFLA